MRIEVLEPQCTGLHHVAFNAALLATTRLAFPEAEILFSGEGAHVAAVREASGFSAEDGVVFRESFGGIVGTDRLGALPGILASARRIAAHCESAGIDTLVLSSATPALLAALSLLKPRRTSVLVVMHACVSELLYNPVTQILRNPLSIHVVARLHVPRGMRVVVLGDSILANLRAMGFAARRWISLDFPFLPGTPSGSIPPEPVCFGYLAGFERNDERMRQMLERVKDRTGCIYSWIGRERAEDPPLTSEEYDRRIQSCHYAVWATDPASYRLRASGTFLDAIGAGKPLVYVSNDFIDACLGGRGGFGWSVRDTEALEEKLIELASAPLDGAYEKLSSGAAATSRTFSPAALHPLWRRGILDAASEN